MECQVEGCETTRHGRKDYCRKHYARFMRTGSTDYRSFKPVYTHDKPCVAPNCTEKCVHLGTQLCEWHYDDHREQVKLAKTERLREAEELENLDTQDFWMWILRNYDPERLVKEGLTK